jgi:murein DD-endopeptidase MepM/ murein hydrolase activator NlpD
LDISQFLINTGFNKSLIKINAFKDKKFKEWIFSPGMLFGAMDKWWGAGKRDKPHEGLDLCFYADHEQRILRLTEGIKIPSIFDGVVERIINDFLGKSIIIKHNFSVNSGSAFYTIYGHVIPGKSIDEGAVVKRGDIIAVLAGTGKSKAKIFPHLHISLGYINEGIPFHKLNWDTINDPKIFFLHDPIKIIGSEYSVISYHKIINHIDR